MDKLNISGSGSEVFIGIDVHKKSYTVSCVMGGVLQKRWRMRADAEQLVKTLKKSFSGENLEVAYEAGFSGYVLYRYLLSQGIRVIVVNPSSIEIASNNRVKTDKRDSAKLAFQLAAGRLKGISIPTEEQEKRRLITRGRQELIKERTRIRNQIRFKLHQFGLIDSEDNSRLTKSFVLEVVAKIDNVELTKMVFGYLSVWESLEAQIVEMDKEIAKQSLDDPLEHLYMSVSGIGKVASRILSNELGDMRRFKNERSLFSYTGLTPQEYSSGEARRLGHITRQGNARVRGVLVECAWNALRQDPKLKADFERISHRTGKKIAIVAIARKLAGRVRAVLRDNSPYKINYPATA